MGESKRIGMCTGVSRLDDAAFIYSAWSGLKRAKEDYGLETTVLESETPDDDEKHLRYLAENGFDLVWGVGFHMEEAMLATAADYPDTAFGMIDVSRETVPENVVAITFREEEGSFLAGYAAAKTTETKKIGFVGGMDVPLIRRFRTGYEAGAANADPSVEVVVEYAGSFLSYQKGQELAKQLFDGGADIIFHAAGTLGKGIIRYAKDAGTSAGLVIGVDIDQSFLAPSHVLTSMIKDLEGSLFRAIGEFTKGDLKLGSIRNFGLADGAVSLTALGTDRAPAGLSDELAEVKKKIVSGEITVPV